MNLIFCYVPHSHNYFDVLFVESLTHFHSECLVCCHLPPSSEEPPVPFQLLYQLDLLSSVTLTFSSALRLVLSVSVDHRLCKVPLQCITFSVTLISTFIIIIIMIMIIIIIVMHHVHDCFNGHFKHLYGLANGHHFPSVL